MKNKGIVFGVLGAVALCICVYVGTNIAFRSALRANCPEELNCGCFVGVISKNVSFVGKLELLLSDASPVEVMKDVPIMGLLGCALMGEAKLW